MSDVATETDIPVRSSSELGSSARQSPVFYLVDWLPPDFGAVGQYAMLFSRQMAGAGRKVRLIGLNSQHHSSEQERFGNGGVLEITRLHLAPFDKSSNSKRLIGAIDANLRLVWPVIKDEGARGADVLFTGSPPFMLFFAFLTKWLRGTRLVYRITDFYPEVLFAAWGRRPALLVIFERITWYLRRRVDVFEVLGEDQRRLLLAGGIRPERIILKRDVSPVTVSGREKPVPRPAGLIGKKVLLYSGNLGVAHEVETVLKGLARHHRQGSGRFALWLNASGQGVQPLINGLRAHGIPFALTDPAPLEELPAVLTAADAHLITLKPNFSGYVLPSKVYACLGSQRPIVFVGPKSSDVHLLCSKEATHHYEHVTVGDIDAFANALERLAS
jgi:Glycosyl transferase 4-like domain